MRKGYPSDWRKRSKIERQKANHRCKNCHRQDAPNTCYRLEVHHIDANKRNGLPSNLVALCLRCHRTYQDYRPQQLLLPHFPQPAWMIERKKISKWGNRKHKS